MTTVHIDRTRHDFLGKLLQPEYVGNLRAYVAWQQEYREAVASGSTLPPAPEFWPVSINWDPTTWCNYRCPHCIDWKVLWGGVHFDETVLKETFDELIAHGLKSVIIIGGGEPTVYKNLAHWVRYLKQKGLQIGIISNGSRNDVLAEIASHLTPPDYIRLSLDAGRDDTFRRSHDPRKQNLTLGHICGGVPAIRNANPRISIGFSFIVTWENAVSLEGVPLIPNIDEIEEAAALARSSRFTEFTIKPVLTRLPDGSECMDPSVLADRARTIARIQEGIAKAEALQTEDFKVITTTNLKVFFAGDESRYRNQPHTCHFTFARLVLSPRGIELCPAHRGNAPAKVAEMDGFTREKQESTMAAIARSILEFNAHAECKQITCLYNSANWGIEKYIIDPASFPIEGAPGVGNIFI